MTKPFATLLLAALLAGCAQSASSPDVRNPDPAHNARNALDWAGSYRGVLPCADCVGIETLVELREDGSFRRRTRYLDEDGVSIPEEGSFRWNEAGDTVLLDASPPSRYFVAENRLLHLDLEGERITGPLAEHYVLSKLGTGLGGRRWELVELRGQAVQPLPRAPYLEFDTATGRVSGFGGCNGFQGGFRLDEERLRLSFENLNSTLMACASGMELERSLHDVLESTDNYSLTGWQLTLNRARMAPLARFEAVFP